MSKAKAVLGKDLMLFVEAKALALATSCKLGLSAETIDTQSKDSGIWTEKDIKNCLGTLRVITCLVLTLTRIATTSCLPCLLNINLLR